MSPALWMDAQAESETVTKSHAGKYINLMINYPFSVALVLASAAASADFELPFSFIRKKPAKIPFHLRSSKDNEYREIQIAKIATHGASGFGCTGFGPNARAVSRCGRCVRESARWRASSFTPCFL